MCGSIRADAVATDRNIVPGSCIDIVLCEVCNTPSLGCFAPGVMLPLATGRWCGARSWIPDQSSRSNATAALPWLHDLRTFTIIVNERRTGSDGLAPVMGSHTCRS